MLYTLLLLLTTGMPGTYIDVGISAGYFTDYDDCMEVGKIILEDYPGFTVHTFECNEVEPDDNE